ncbi:hypothetical protein DY000_02023931 [Brassica cretica]|uniref:Uncharacterized protein n=1 Tax=Brassica cretica TaxID=69181 RepID=A0ABQ7EGT2_BRACR|nr:hypothetical protein DY000_02023931 [Brassica cretica]
MKIFTKFRKIIMKFIFTIPSSSSSATRRRCKLADSCSDVKLVVTVLQQCCLECLVNPTVRSSLIELKFGRGVVDWFILDFYGGISLWLPESL